MRAEEGHDAAASVLGWLLVVARGPCELAHHDEDDGIGVARAVMIVEERVTSAGVFLDVIVHAECLQHVCEDHRAG